jgi:hypothetical protein
MLVKRVRDARRRRETHHTAGKRPPTRSPRSSRRPASAASRSL